MSVRGWGIGVGRRLRVGGMPVRCLLHGRDAPGNGKADGQRNRQQDAIVAVELDLGQEVGRHDAEEGPGCHRQRNAQEISLVLPEQPEAGQKADGPERHHRRIQPVDDQPQSRRSVGIDHERRDDAGIKGFVEEHGQKRGKAGEQLGAVRRIGVDRGRERRFA